MSKKCQTYILCNHHCHWSCSSLTNAMQQKLTSLKLRTGLWSISWSSLTHIICITVSVWIRVNTTVFPQLRDFVWVKAAGWGRTVHILVRSTSLQSQLWKSTAGDYFLPVNRQLCSSIWVTSHSAKEKSGELLSTMHTTATAVYNNYLSKIKHTLGTRFCTPNWHENKLCTHRNNPLTNRSFQFCGTWQQSWRMHFTNHTSKHRASDYFWSFPHPLHMATLLYLSEVKNHVVLTYRITLHHRSHGCDIQPISRDLECF